jgi:hypothetical protein
MSWTNRGTVDLRPIVAPIVMLRRWSAGLRPGVFVKCAASSQVLDSLERTVPLTWFSTSSVAGSHEHGFRV